MQKQYSVLINASAQKTFSCITEKEKMRELMNGQIATKFKTLNDFHDPVGTKFRQNIAGLLQLDGEVIAYRRPVLFGIGLEIMGLKGTLFYNLEASDRDKTSLKFDVEFFDATEAKKILLKTLYPLFNKIIESYLKSLKKVAEKP